MTKYTQLLLDRWNGELTNMRAVSLSPGMQMKCNEPLLEMLMAEIFKREQDVNFLENAVTADEKEQKELNEQAGAANRWELDQIRHILSQTLIHPQNSPEPLHLRVRHLAEALHGVARFTTAKPITLLPEPQPA